MEKKLILVFVPIVAIYLFINFYLYVLVDCWVLDEKAFYYSSISFDYGLKGFIFCENKLGYGPFYWWILSIANNFKILRFLSFCYLALIPVIIWLVGTKLNQSKLFKIYACLLLISYTSSWAYSKIIGPELLSVFLGLFGFYLSLSKQTSLVGFFLTGLSFGVKLNSISFCLFSYLFRIFTLRKSKANFQKNLQETLKIGTFAAAGFLVSTPIFLLNPIMVIDNVLSHGNAIFTAKNLNHIFFSNDYTWDGIVNNGLFNTSLNIFLFLMMILVSIKKLIDIRVFTSFTITAIFLTIQILSASNYLYWYWFPIIFLSPLLIFSFREDYITRKFFGIILILNFFLNMPTIYKKIKYKAMHHKILQDKVSIKKLIENVEANHPNAEFLYFTEFGLNPSPTFTVWNLLKRHEKKEISFEKKEKILFLGKRFLETNLKPEIFLKHKAENKKFNSKSLEQHPYIKVIKLP